ncbi:MAG: NAD-dependent epimerase/dehydratase family protein [Myxococcota bacterium]|jgi:NADH dehydrogenase|nr:NAD-dependent epimerase/dehydratase family protein [Myxococcota bacterium]
MDGPILITGASGFVGVHLARRLLREGRTCRGLVRTTSATAPLRALGVPLAVGDLTRPSTLDDALAGCSAVVHLAGAADVADRSLNERVNVEGTAAVGRACERAGVRRVLHFSTNCALRELRDAYGESKRRGEEALAACDLDLRIFRPTMIYGEGSKEFATFVRTVGRSPLVPVPGSGQHILRPVFVDDVLDAAVAALIRDGLAGRAYDIMGPTEIVLDDLIAQVARRIGVRRRPVHIPLSLSLAGVRALGRVWTHPPVVPDQVLAFAQDTRGDLEPAARDLDWHPVDIETGLDRLFARADWRRLGSPPPVD